MKPGVVWSTILVLVLAGTGCDAADPGRGVSLGDLEAEAILRAPVPGASVGRVAPGSDDAGPSMTRLMDVLGDWNSVSVAIAGTVREYGWTVESINCVGTGNDVIAKKMIGETWVLLESGAGTRGAGIVLRIDPTQEPPGGFTVSGPCSASLVAVASS